MGPKLKNSPKEKVSRVDPNNDIKKAQKNYFNPSAANCYHVAKTEKTFVTSRVFLHSKKFYVKINISRST